MDLNSMLDGLRNYPCGKTHTFDVKKICIEHNITENAGYILRNQGFPDKLLFVADRNTLRASEGLEQALLSSGFILDKVIFDNMNCARAENVEQLMNVCSEAGG